MNKNFLFSICLLVGAFSVKGQYKQSIGFNGMYPGLSLDYERFVYAKNNHHLSWRGTVGFSVKYNDIMFGTDFIYGFGKHHRFEASYHLGFLPNRIINQGDDLYKPPIILLTGIRLNYAYHAKNNPMIYRIGIMPAAIFNFSKRFGNDNRLLQNSDLIYLGIGYRF
jgi:hypothetical protein